MAMFKAVVMELLKLLCAVFLFGHSYRLLPANPASACGSDRDLSLRVFVAHYFLFCATLTAAMLLLAVRMALNAAEHGADDVAEAAARVEGITSVANRWKRAALRGTLLLAVILSAAAAFLAVVAFEDGYRYRRGCAGGVVDGSRSPMAAVLMVFMAGLHGFFAWVAVCKD